MLSLAGFPPLVGFVGKILLLEAAFSGGFAWLAGFAAINMAVGLYYYARVVAAMYFRSPHRTEALAADGRATAVASVAALLTLLLGVLPAWGLKIATWQADSRPPETTTWPGDTHPPGEGFGRASPQE